MLALPQTLPAASIKDIAMGSPVVKEGGSTEVGTGSDVGALSDKAWVGGKLLRPRAVRLGTL